MAESPSHAPIPSPVPAVSDIETLQYWCHYCNKFVSTETLANATDVICIECKDGFVELIPATSTPPSATPSLTSDQADDSIGSQFLQMLRIIAQAAREDDAPPPPPQDPQSEDDFLRIELDGWDNDEDEDEEEDDDDDDINGNDNENEENREEGEHEGEEVQSDNEDDENRDEDDEENLQRRRRNLLRLRIPRARSGRNRILDWAEILMGLEDNSIEFRVEVSESDRYVGNREDYVDAAGYEALLQTLAESDGGRRGAPPAAKSAVSALPTVKVMSDQETVVCAVCKDMVCVGEMETKLPCGHGYHGECIVPWLGSRNSCPVCRFELPTDDPEYEEERKKKVVGAVGGASGSGGESSGSI